MRIRLPAVSSASLLATLVLLLPISAMSKTITVPRCQWPPCPDTTDTYNSIDSALAAAKGGDRIYIQSGTYVAPSGSWKIKVPIEIFGDGPGDPHFGSGSKATYLRPLNVWEPVFKLDLSLATTHLQNIFIHDLKIGLDSLPSAGSGDGIYFITSASRSLNHVRLARLEITNMAGDGVHIEGEDAGDGAINDLSIEDCVMNSNRNRGLFVVNAQMFRLEGGAYSANRSHGVHVRDSNAPQLNAFECGVNQSGYSGGDDSQLFFENCTAFRVTGAHLENWTSSSTVRSAVGVVSCRGGYIGSCTFGNLSGTGARGVRIWSGNNTGVTVGPNMWSGVPTMVEIQDDATITSCVIEPQATYGWDAGSYTPKFVVPETADRGHIVVSPTSGPSRVMAGVGLPLLSTVRRDSMTAPSGGGTRREGLLIYNSTKHLLNVWDGTRWLEGTGGVAGSEYNNTNVTAPITPAVTLLNSPPAGMYRLTIYGLTKTALNAAHSIKVYWTDEAANRSLEFVLGAAAGSLVVETPSIYVASGSLTFDTSTTGTMSGSLALRIRVEALP